MTEGEPGDTRVSHGICLECSRRFFPSGPRLAVVPRDRAFLVAEIESAFQSIGGFRVILDRRWSERRCRRTKVRDERRCHRKDRRQLPSPIVGAMPAVGGLWIAGGRSLSSEHPGGFPGPNEPSRGWRLLDRPPCVQNAP